MIFYRTLGEWILRPLLPRLYRIEGEGWDRIPAEGPAVLAANHESLIDPFILGVATPRPIHYMAKAELWRYPLLKQIMNAFGTFPVERGVSDSAAISHGRELLERGELLGVFPQGTCLPYRVRPYRRGAARLALELGAPLLPVCVVGTERALRPHRLKLGLPKIRILVGERLQTAARAATPEAAEELTARLQAAIEQLRRPHGEPAHVWIEGARPSSQRPQPET